MTTILPLAALTGPWRVAALTALGGLALGMLLVARKRVRGTTMLAPWAWLTAALAAVVAAEVASALYAASAGHEARWSGPLRAAAAVGLVCPVVSSLGAKRPQSSAWQFVVLSLWVLLALPALRVLLVRPSANFHLPQPLALLAVAILVMGVADRLMTRFGWAALLLAAGAIALLSEHISWLPQPSPGMAPIVGLALVCVAGGAALLAPGVRRRGLQAYDRLWLDVRDTIGLLWSLRLAERFNASAEAAEWPVRLGWGGFMPQASQQSGRGNELLPSIVIPTEAGHTFTALLRRFVSRDWIAARLESNV